MHLNIDFFNKYVKRKFSFYLVSYSLAFLPIYFLLLSSASPFSYYSSITAIYLCMEMIQRSGALRGGIITSCRRQIMITPSSSSSGMPIPGRGFQGIAIELGSFGRGKRHWRLGGHNFFGCRTSAARFGTDGGRFWHRRFRVDRIGLGAVVGFRTVATRTSF